MHLCLGSTDKPTHVTICGCPNVSTACQACTTFQIGKCAPFYQCFDQSNGLFAHVFPVLKDGDIVTMNAYTDSSCTIASFDPAANGWEGQCGDSCWSEDISKMGARNCDTSSGMRRKLSTTFIITVLSLIGIANFIIF